MSWLSHALHEGEADVIKYVANTIIAPNESVISAAAGTEAVAGTAQLIAAIQALASKDGPVVSGLVSFVFNTYGPQIEAELPALAGEVAAYIPQVVAAMNAYAVKLASN